MRFKALAAIAFLYMFMPCSSECQEFANSYIYLVKKDSSSTNSDDEIIIKCPCRDCGRHQTKALLIQNKWKCSGCKQDIYSCPKYSDVDRLPY